MCPAEHQCTAVRRPREREAAAYRMRTDGGDEPPLIGRMDGGGFGSDTQDFEELRLRFFIRAPAFFSSRIFHAARKAPNSISSFALAR